MDFLQRTPFFRLLIPLVCGIVAFQHLKLYNLTQLIVLIIALVLILSSLLLLKTKSVYQLRWLFGLGIALFLFLTGYLISEQKHQQAIFSHFDQIGIFRVEIIETPLEKPKSITCKVRVDALYDSTQFVQIREYALVYIAKDSASLCLKKGDVVLLRSVFTRPSKALNPKGFDYASYLLSKGITATAYVGSENWKVLSHNRKFSIKSLTEVSRNKLLEIYHTLNLGKDEFAVLAALTLGYKDAIDPDLREDFSHSGAMHILAVSGLHVGVIYLILNFIFSLVFKSSRWNFLRTFLIVCLLWVYAFITGLPPSVIRSATMFSLVAIGSSLERKSQIYNTISVSAFIILLQNPNYLFDVGFQLSYCAVLSIVYFQPQIAKWIYVKNKFLRAVWDLTAVSLAAQLGTLPLALYYFHQFPNYFLLTNYIAIPLATFIIYVAVLFLSFCWLSWLAWIPAFVLKWLLWILNQSVAFIHDLPHAISIFYINLWQMILLFAVLILASCYVENKKYWSLSAFLSLVLIFILSHVYINYTSLQLDRFVVFADRKHTHVNFINGHKHQLITTDSLAATLAANNFWRSNKLNKPDFHVQSTSYAVTFLGSKILILMDDFLHRKTTELPIEVDYLIIANGIKPRSEELLGCVLPKLCIADQTISDWYVTKLREICAKRNIDFYSVAEQGAYICDFKQGKP